MVFASVGDAFHRTADILFKPFSLKRWVSLVLVAWVAGTLFGGFNLNFNSRSDQEKGKEQAVSAQKRGSESRIGKQLERQHEKKYWYEHSLLKSFRSESGEVPGWYMGLIVWPILLLLALLAVALALAWIWLASRFQFVWLDAVQTGRPQVRRAFRQFELPGDWLATFWVLALLAALLYYAAVLVLPMVIFFKAVSTAPLLFKSGPYLFTTLWPWFLLLAFSLLLTFVLWTVLSDFLVPIMAAETVTVRGALKSWLTLYRPNRWAVWRYMMTKFMAAVLAGAFTTAASVIVMVVFGLAGAAVFGLLYLVFMSWLKLKAVFWVLAVLAGIPFFAAMLMAFGASALPASVFFRTFSLSFLDRLRRPAPAEVQ